MTELEFLAEIKSYVEKTQEAIDGEWGDGRSISQLIADGKMPQPIYSEIIRRIEAFHQKSRQDHLLDQARSIRDEIEVFVFGPSGTETPACAEAWATAKLIAELRDRVEALEDAKRAALSEPDPTPTVRFLTVQDCNDMPKHGENCIAENRPGEIVLDGCFTREDLIEIANTVPTTEA